MKCLTLHAHWAEAIFALGKDVENRTWQTGYRGTLAIHAGITFDLEIAAMLGLDPMQVVRGHIIGTVELVDCARDSASIWANAGQYHWLLRDARRLDQPIRMRGQMGLWDFYASNLSACDLSSADPLYSNTAHGRPPNDPTDEVFPLLGL